MKKILCYVLMPFFSTLLLSGCREANPPVSQTGEIPVKEESSQLQTDLPEEEEPSGEESKEVMAGKLDGFPEIKVTWGINREEIPSAAGSVEWVKKEDNGEGSSVIACGAEPLAYIMQEYGAIPYMPIESEITIEFLNAPAPERMILSDCIINENGSLKYDDRTIITQELDCEGQQASFMLNTNFNAMLSSDLATYQKGGVLRGFKLDCSWADGSNGDFAFVVRTDAACGVENHSTEVYPRSMCGTGIDVFAGIDEIKKNEDGFQLKVILSNQTGDEFIFGDEPRLYRYEGEKAMAVDLKLEAGWEDIANRLKPHQKADFTVDLGAYYGELQFGYYSFRKILTNTASGESQTASVQFTVADE